MRLADAKREATCITQIILVNENNIDAALLRDRIAECKSSKKLKEIITGFIDENDEHRESFQDVLG